MEIWRATKPKKGEKFVPPTDAAAPVDDINNNDAPEDATAEDAEDDDSPELQLKRDSEECDKLDCMDLDCSSDDDDLECFFDAYEFDEDG